MKIGRYVKDLVENDDFSMINEEYGEKNESIREGKSMKLKDLLNEQNQSKSYKRLNIGEEEQEKKMTSEEKKHFLEKYLNIKSLVKQFIVMVTLWKLTAIKVLLKKTK